MSLFPTPQQPARHAAEQITPTGAMGGPSWRYRGSIIHSNERGTLFTLAEPPAGLPGNWSGIGNRREIERVLDAWLDTGRLPAPYVGMG
mgnify:CR=1 FL=1